MMVHMYDANTSYLDNLMPWSENLPDVCKKAPWQNAGSHSLVAAGILSGYELFIAYIAPIRANKGVSLYHAKRGHRVISGGLMLCS